MVASLCQILLSLDPGVFPVIDTVLYEVSTINQGFRPCFLT